MLFDIKDTPPDTKPFLIYPWNQIKNIKSADVNFENMDYETIIHIGWRMVKTCLVNNGIGLAAPQISLFKKIIICKDMEKNSNEFLPTFQMYINPSYSPIKEEGKNTSIESCLSVPEKSYKIARWNSIEVKWFEFSETRQPIKKTKKLTNFSAKLIQHEIEHLEGISIPQRYILQKNYKNNSIKKKNRKKKRK